MDMKIPPSIGPNGPQPGSEPLSTKGLTPLGAVPPSLSSVPLKSDLNKFEKLMVALMAMAKEAKKDKPKSMD